MGLFHGKFPFLPLRSREVRGKGRSGTLGNRLLLALVPTVALITAAAGYVGYRISLNFLNTSLERTVRILDLAMASAVENMLEQARRDLAMIAQEPGVDLLRMRDFLSRTTASGGLRYREMAYISASAGASQFLIARGGQTAEVLAEGMHDIRPSPYLLLERGGGLATGETHVTPVVSVEHPFPGDGQANRRISSHVIRLVTPYSPDGKDRGLLMLGLDAKEVRNVLSRYNSPASPLWAFPRSEEVRFAYLCDPEGWILFQSEDVAAPDAPLGAYLARSGYEGALGRAGMPGAFRPNSSYGAFWRGVTELAAGRASFQVIDSGDDMSSRVSTAFFALAPVRFSPGAGKPARVYAGVAFVDRTLLTVAAGYRHLDAMFLLSLGAVLLLTLVVTVLSKLYTAPILRLAEKARSLRAGDIRPVESQSAGYETGVLRDALNHLIGIMERQAGEVRTKDEAIRAMAMRERAAAPEDGEASPDSDVLPEMAGVGPRMDKLRNDIVKAAQADVDVLILGETGTGKQLAAEAIHRRGRRAERPFIAINCGALDENLLLDTLFGHVKGAFTEAKADRNGAFLEAHGGALFLDEIQTASPKVQQSLLRAIEARKIRPLGSDREVDVDVRLVAATNVNLAEAAARGEFREDLYFRLRVVSISTPALREHPESIPHLAARFLAEAARVAGKTGLGFTRGALKKLSGHSWPGNIRELKNCITMAAVMAEGPLIGAADVLLGGEEAEVPGAAQAEDAAAAEAPAVSRPDPWGRSSPLLPDEHPPARTAPPSAPGPEGPPPGLNSRQRAAWPAIAAAGEITRSRYQEAVGGDLPSRTAIHDLQDLVKRGLLVMTGRGPATRYLLAPGRNGR
ncbi:MAG: sigma 54-interacting transcriptional regulator [Thermodesulfobacteriota bacterium]